MIAPGTEVQFRSGRNRCVGTVTSLIGGTHAVVAVHTSLRGGTRLAHVPTLRYVGPTEAMRVAW